ncbi:MAG: patatin-like phospholipase family protein, partial [Rhodocyclaceae bacterium]
MEDNAAQPATPSSSRRFPHNAAIRVRRRRAGIAADAPVWGLALSGGGIRSATFCFGLIRALAHRRLFLRFDLLSTVSGGGYIGAAVGRLFSPAPAAANTASAAQIEADLDGQFAGPSARRPGGERASSWFLWWLRANGRYLIPRGAKDRTFAIALYARNLLAIHLELGVLAVVLGLLLAAVDLGGWGWAFQWGYGDGDVGRRFEILGRVPSWLPTLWLAAPVLAVIMGCWCAAYWHLGWMLSPTRRQVLVSLVIALLIGTAWGLWVTPVRGAVGDVLRLIAWGAVPALAAIFALGALVALVAAGVFDRGTDKTTPNRMAYVGDMTRSALTRQLANMLRLAGVLALLGLLDRAAWYLAFSRVEAQSVGLYLAMAVAAVRAALPVVSSLTARNPGGRSGLMSVARLVGYALTFALLAWWASLVYGSVLGALYDGVQDPRHLLRFDAAWQMWGLEFVPAVLYVVLTGANLDFLNASSLYTFYKARLTRSYLGAANRERFKDGTVSALEAVAKPLAGFRPRAVGQVAPHDDVALARYAPEKAGGPVHLINICVNQTTDPRGGLFNQDRKGVLMTLASRGWMKVADQPWSKRAPQLSLGSLVAISGAAVAPGMGATTSSGMSALLTFAGVRLGFWWRGATRQRADRWWQRRFAKYYALADEVSGRFEGTQRERWFLSDGGHFENTGAYALLAERAEVIVVADCGADPAYAFKDLEKLVRIARIDLQADIRFQRPRQNAGLAAFGSLNELASPRSSACLAFAKITYGGQAQSSGILLLIKPNICSGLPVDLMNFKGQNPDFPQQTTADQFFSEAQWESYFLLGQYLGGQLSHGLIEDLRTHADAYFEPDDCSPFEAQAADPGSVVKRAAAVVSRMPARLGTSAAVGATVGLGAAATLGAATWQAIDSVRSAYGDKTTAERAAMNQLAQLWGKLPAGQGTAEEAARVNELAAALVSTADTLCPTHEANWFMTSPIGNRILLYTTQRCETLDAGARGDACRVMLEAKTTSLRTPYQFCLQAPEEKTRRPPPLYWGFDYANKRPPYYWHPCDPAWGELNETEAAYRHSFGALTQVQYDADKSGAAAGCPVPGA